VAAGIAYGISHYVTNKLIDIPEQRGIKDDVLEAILKGATTATSTVLALDYGAAPFQQAVRAIEPVGTTNPAFRLIK
jgi:hypothetical protein